MAKALQNQLETVYLHVALDGFASMFPESKLSNPTLCSSAEPKLFAGFYHSVAALVSCGNQVIVDTVAQERCSRIFKPLFEPFNVIYIAVKCPIEELERRELARGDRHIGLAHRQFADIHNFLRYDIEVDTHQQSAEICAAHIKRFITSKEHTNSQHSPKCA